MLRRLGHIDGEDVVQLKGRAACELDTADELLATELMFNGVFQNLDAHHLVALVSCLVPVENTKSEVRPPCDAPRPCTWVLETGARWNASAQRPSCTS